MPSLLVMQCRRVQSDASAMRMISPGRVCELTLFCVYLRNREQGPVIAAALQVYKNSSACFPNEVKMDG